MEQYLIGRAMGVWRTSDGKKRGEKRPELVVYWGAGWKRRENQTPK